MSPRRGTASTWRLLWVFTAAGDPCATYLSQLWRNWHVDGETVAQDGFGSLGQVGMREEGFRAVRCNDRTSWSMGWILRRRPWV